MLGATNGTLSLENTAMEFIRFGHGKRQLIMLQGLGDGLKTVKGMALPMGFAYREYAKHFTVHVFSRKNHMEAGYTTRDMAQDIKLGMEQLEIPSADVLGVSQGGMIAQYLAIDYPKAVNRLALAVTLSKPNKTVRETVSGWISLAKDRRYKELLIDTAEKSYTEQYLKRYRAMYPLMGLLPKPKDFSRFLVLAQACLGHNAYGELGRIKCPALVIGGEDDRVVGATASREMADQISGSRLVMHPDLGHGLYTQAKDFNSSVRAFLMNE